VTQAFSLGEGEGTTGKEKDRERKGKDCLFGMETRIMYIRVECLTLYIGCGCFTAISLVSAFINSSMLCFWLLDMEPVRTEVIRHLHGSRTFLTFLVGLHGHQMTIVVPLRICGTPAENVDRRPHGLGEIDVDVVWADLNGSAYNWNYSTTVYA
jgi:hypothetical protein